MNLVALPAFTDNYVWMLHDGQRAVVVDPGEAPPVEAALDAQGLELQAILVTHHHPDHVGGIDRLRPRLRGPVHGPARERIPAPFEARVEGDTFPALGLSWQVLEVPGHTAGHIAYLVQGAGADPILFCGDTLFSAGCGRLFEGTAAQLHGSLQRLGELPGRTRVCCTHEYTVSNLRFACAVEPANARAAQHLRHCQALREHGGITLPSSIELERQINPFLRCAEPAVVTAARQAGAADESPVAVFAALREWKNGFR